ncbi:MAG: LptF/LptG family permease [Abditibacteriota bacterium]|nr:LptF/LptG family permease [Abditibacteriota bacterium]
MRLSDKYILKEMTAPFFLGFFLILVLVFGNIVYANLNLIVSRLSQWRLVSCYLLCKLPNCILMSLPAGAIFGTCMSLGRLSRENELTALRIAGIGSVKIIRSVICFGLLLTLAGYLFQEFGVVRSELAADNLMKRIYSVPGDLPIEPDMFVKSGDYCIRVRNIERKDGEIIYHRVMLYRLNWSADYPALITAGRAVERSGVWLLEKGNSYVFDKDGLPLTITSFEKLRLNMDSSVFASLTGVRRENSSYSCLQLREKVREYRKAGIKPGDIELEYAFKQAFPVSSLAILLCVAPLCLRLPRKSAGSSLVVGIGVFFIYWNIMWFSRVLGQTGGLDPYLAGWSIAICFGVAGAILIAGLDR